ncbi:hypothetical protein B273_0315 [SAR86 cluster bacterium SAR86E]|uniref:Uncharacterized protein n=1 Tax=SAR86 cluster bacterium SAR86E TaxID=1208365 RepID=K6GJS5_9GAMM|nr:hypothetical protein B273_0315 [SAR86 cluster bacterium SAR86E]
MASISSGFRFLNSDSFIHSFLIFSQRKKKCKKDKFYFFIIFLIGF